MLLSLTESMASNSWWRAPGHGAVATPSRTFTRAALGAVVALLLQLAPVEAQVLRFVSTTGNDANSCTTPATSCRTLQRAHDIANFTLNKIILLDSGDFGAVTITKSIEIATIGVHAHLFNGGGEGVFTKITIDAEPDDVIGIDGLAMGRNAPDGNNSGIDFISGGKLRLRNCAIRNFSTAGIRIRAGGSKRVFVSDCTIAANKHGIWARGGRGNVRVLLDRVTVEGNIRNGIRSQGSGARVRVSRSTVTNNGKGLNAVNGGKIISLGNNTVAANRRNGAPTAAVALK